MKNVTQNLKNLVKKRKISKVVIKQGSIKAYKSRSNGDNAESYVYSSYNNQ